MPAEYELWARVRKRGTFQLTGILIMGQEKLGESEGWERWVRRGSRKKPW